MLWHYMDRLMKVIAFGSVIASAVIGFLLYFKDDLRAAFGTASQEQVDAILNGLDGVRSQVIENRRLLTDVVRRIDVNIPERVAIYDPRRSYFIDPVCVAGEWCELKVTLERTPRGMERTDDGRLKCRRVGEPIAEIEDIAGKRGLVTLSFLEPGRAPLPRNLTRFGEIEIFAWIKIPVANAYQDGAAIAVISASYEVPDCFTASESSPNLHFTLQSNAKRLGGD